MPSPSGTYSFGEDTAREAERLAAVERALDGSTQACLLEAGVGERWHCWEVGAGRGSIAAWLGHVVGPRGHVLATDLDERWFQGHLSNVVFAVHDVAAEPPPAEQFDLIHARLVLEHLEEPAAAVARLSAALKPGGVLVAEDSAGLQIRTTQRQPLFDALTPAWERAGHAVDWNAGYGSRLLEDLRAAGLAELHGREYRTTSPGGDDWLHLKSGLRRLDSQLQRQGITEEDLAALIGVLDDPACLITGPPILIARGRRAH